MHIGIGHADHGIERRHQRGQLVQLAKKIDIVKFENIEFDDIDADRL